MLYISITQVLQVTRNVQTVYKMTAVSTVIIRKFPISILELSILGRIAIQKFHKIAIVDTSFYEGGIYLFLLSS